MTVLKYLELERKTWPLTEAERNVICRAFAISPHQLNIPSTPSDSHAGGAAVVSTSTP